jgi:hypothetical protein
MEGMMVVDEDDDRTVELILELSVKKFSSWVDGWRGA